AGPSVADVQIGPELLQPPRPRLVVRDSPTERERATEQKHLRLAVARRAQPHPDPPSAIGRYRHLDRSPARRVRAVDPVSGAEPPPELGVRIVPRRLERRGRDGPPGPTSGRAQETLRRDE